MSFETEVIALRGRLYARAMNLTRRNHEASEDLVQTTFLKAIKNKDQFKTDTGLSQWLHTILRNEFLSGVRRINLVGEDPDDFYTNNAKSLPDQLDKIALMELSYHIDLLPKAQKESLLMVAVEGLSYEEVAQKLNTATGTVKSRVCRARMALQEKLGLDLSTDPLTQSVMTNDHFSNDPS